MLTTGNASTASVSVPLRLMPWPMMLDTNWPIPSGSVRSPPSGYPLPRHQPSTSAGSTTRPRYGHDDLLRSSSRGRCNRSGERARQHEPSSQRADGRAERELAESSFAPFIERTGIRGALGSANMSFTSTPVHLSAGVVVRTVTSGFWPSAGTCRRCRRGGSRRFQCW